MAVEFSLPRVGLVGTPDQILLIAPILNQAGFVLKAVWCKSLEIAQQLADEYSIEHCVSTFQELLILHDVDLIYVATEPFLQAEVAVKALTSGKHCISIKPPTVSSKEAEKMVTLSRYYPQLHSVLESHIRFLPCFLQLKEMCVSGSLGKIHAIDVRISISSLIGNESYSWKCDPTLGGGVLNIVGSHFIDLICHLCGPIEQVHCLLATFEQSTRSIHSYRSIESDDYCMLQMKCANSVGTILINSHHSSIYQLEVSVTASNGRAIVRDLDLYLQENGKEEGIHHKEELMTDKMIDEANELNIPPMLYYSTILGHKGMLQEFRKMYLMDKQHNTVSRLASFADGHHLRTVLDCAYESHKSSSWIQIPITNQTSGNATNPFWTSTSGGVNTESDKPPMAYMYV
jgi:predicted dehydrogenase